MYAYSGYIGCHPGFQKRAKKTVTGFILIRGECRIIRVLLKINLCLRHILTYIASTLENLWQNLSGSKSFPVWSFSKCVVEAQMQSAMLIELSKFSRELCLRHPPCCKDDQSYYENCQSMKMWPCFFVVQSRRHSGRPILFLGLPQLMIWSCPWMTSCHLISWGSWPSSFLVILTWRTVRRQDALCCL